MVEALRKLASRTIVGLEVLSDAEIVALCQKELPSDLTAYRELLRRYEGLVYNTCMKLIGSKQDAEEVAQDALIQVFHKIHLFEGRSEFKTWLYKIVHNYCRNRLTKIIRKRKGSEQFEEYSSANEPDTEEPKDQGLASELVQETMSKMKEKEREILVMKFTTGMTIPEISEAMGIGESATKMRFYRALDSFKALYGDINKANSTQQA
mgnify:FL=1